MTTAQDIALIRDELKHLRDFANDMRWGGWYEEWGLAKAALDALTRIEVDIKNKQIGMELPE